MSIDPTETITTADCTAAWQDDRGKDHECMEDADHDGGHECGCGARVPRWLLEAATGDHEAHTRRVWVAAYRHAAHEVWNNEPDGELAAMLRQNAEWIEAGELSPWRTDAPPAAPAPPETAAQPDPGTVAPPDRQGAADIPALVAMPDLTDRERADFLAAAAELDGEPAPLDLDAIERMTHDSHDPIMAMQARHLVAGIAAVLDSVDRAEAAHIRIRQGTEDVCAACSDAWVQQVWPCPTALLAGAVRRHLATVPTLTANQSTTEETGHV